MTAWWCVIRYADNFIVIVVSDDSHDRIADAAVQELSHGKTESDSENPWVRTPIRVWQCYLISFIPKW